MAKPQDTEGQPDSAKGVTRDLASRIASAKREREIEDNRASRDASPEMTGLARGLRIGTEFIAAILVGSVLGYLIDLGLGTSPWGLLIMFLVGFAAGILNVTRVVAQMNAASPPPPPGSDMGPDVEDEEEDK
ncbi:AtpZ/AtpI family protein [Devosia oryziradicis]|uniref:AtpZ/AtpI family protein n=1 Tax=Devosia oryziradicis TaxID=2801335 RepID=A0ABX7BZG7_9HYPH|nr:AtpZ/AtpI family protein [Devosia oryziradicis]QQR35815.1 AtpZ/AtpI family protein [Devosia oryziradicis]